MLVHLDQKAHPRQVIHLVLRGGGVSLPDAAARTMYIYLFYVCNLYNVYMYIMFLMYIIYIMYICI